MNFIKSIKDKINKQSLKTFFQKQGLYVLIFLCVLAAGITALVAWPRAEENIPDGSNQDVSLIDVPSLEDELAASPTAKPSVSPSPSPSQSPTPSVQVNKNGSGSITLKKPVDGEIINGFSGSGLVYYASLNMWATHNGVDIKADKDTPVVAALSGTVESVSANETDGGVVSISHSNKTTTVYKGLGQVTVKEGDKVNAGDEIGTVGDMPKESDLSYHLHFEYIVNGVYKDPSKLFRD